MSKEKHLEEKEHSCACCSNEQDHCHDHDHEEDHCGCHNEQHVHEDHCDCHDEHHEHEAHCHCHDEHHGHHHHDHGDSCGCGCGCGHDHNDEDAKRDLVFIGVGIALLIAGFLTGGTIRIILHLASYLVLGAEIIISAAKGLFRGAFADENLLMSVATIGAIILGDYEEAVMVMLLYRIGELLQGLAVSKSRKSIRETVNLRPDIAHVVRGGVEADLDPAEISIGETILVKPGERVPLDGVVLTGESFMDCAAITGESVPVHVAEGSEVQSGAINKAGVLTVSVTKNVTDSTAARIMDAIEDAVESKPKLETFITRFSKIYTPTVMVLTLLVAVIPPLLGLGEFAIWVKRGLLLLVVSCPCALVLSIPLTFFAGLARESAEGVLLKGANVLEILTGIKAVAFDKTGTLTKGTFEIQRIFPENGFTEEKLLSLAAAVEKQSLHPIAQAISAAVPDQEPAQHMQERAGYGVSGEVDGCKVHVGNARMMAELSITGISEDSHGTCIHVAVDGVYAGKILIGDELKESAGDTVSLLQKRACNVALLTGDNEAAAAHTAKETGIAEVYSSLLPGDKLSTLQAIRQKHGPVLFLGDGINDSPVLAGADVGCAIGFGGTDAAIEAADMVLMNENLRKLPAAMRIADKTMRIARQNVTFALAVKFIVMVLGIMGKAQMWMAVFADVGTALLCVLNALRLLAYKKSSSI